MFVLSIVRPFRGLEFGFIGRNSNPGCPYQLFPHPSVWSGFHACCLVATGGPLCSELRSITTAPGKAALEERVLLRWEEQYSGVPSQTSSLTSLVASGPHGHPCCQEGRADTYPAMGMETPWEG